VEILPTATSYGGARAHVRYLGIDDEEGTVQSRGDRPRYDRLVPARASMGWVLQLAQTDPDAASESIDLIEIVYAIADRPKPASPRRRTQLEKGTRLASGKSSARVLNRLGW
jgi:hypothetical protein